MINFDDTFWSACATNDNTNDNLDIGNLSDFDFSGFKTNFQFNKKKVLEDYLKESEETKNSELKLIDVNFFFFPDRVKDFFWVEKLILDNNKITKLDETFLFLKNLKYLEIKNNKIICLQCDYLPDTLETFIFTGNQTLRILNLKNGLKYINFSRNEIRNIESPIPESVIELNLSNNKLMFLLPRIQNCMQLIDLDISNTNIMNIDTLPVNIQVLNAYGCKISQIDKFPRDLIKFIGYRSTITKITAEFPLNLREFDVFNNLLKEVPPFPSSIETIDLSHNILEKMPLFPQTTKTIDLKENSKLSLDEIKDAISQNPNVKIMFSEPSPIRNNYEYCDNDNDNDNDPFKDYPYKTPSNPFKNYRKEGFHGFRYNFNNFNNFKKENIYSPPKAQSFIGEFNESNPHYIVLDSIYDV
jgi:hypothetical protein